MSNHSELMQCWDIIECKRKNQCLLVADKEKPCWEEVKDDNACSFHICVDCLVYLVNQETSLISDEEFCSILAQRKEIGIRNYGCHLADAVR